MGSRSARWHAQLGDVLVLELGRAEWGRGGGTYERAKPCEVGPLETWEKFWESLIDKRNGLGGGVLGFSLWGFTPPPRILSSAFSREGPATSINPPSTVIAATPPQLPPIPVRERPLKQAVGRRGRESGDQGCGTRSPRGNLAMGLPQRGKRSEKLSVMKSWTLESGGQMRWILGGNVLSIFPQKQMLKICHSKLHHLFHCMHRDVSPRVHGRGIFV